MGNSPSTSNHHQHHHQQHHSQNQQNHSQNHQHHQQQHHQNQQQHNHQQNYPQPQQQHQQHQHNKPQAAGGTVNKKDVTFRDWGGWAKRHELGFNHGTPLYFLKYYIEENRAGYEDGGGGEGVGGDGVGGAKRRELRADHRQFNSHTDRRPGEKMPHQNGPQDGDIWSGPRTTVRNYGSPDPKKPRVMLTSQFTQPDPDNPSNAFMVRPGGDVRPPVANGYATFNDAAYRYSMPASRGNGEGSLDECATFKPAYDSDGGMDDGRTESSQELWSAEWQATHPHDDAMDSSPAASLDAEPRGAPLRVQVDQNHALGYPSPTDSFTSSSDDVSPLYATVQKPWSSASASPVSSADPPEPPPLPPMHGRKGAASNGETGERDIARRPGKHICTLQL